MSMKRSGWQLFGMQMAFALICGGALACTQPSQPHTLRVYAASSLVDAFDAIKENFLATHPGVDVRLVYAGSQVLRAQIEQGAHVDVFASAHRRDLDRLKSHNLVSEPTEFAQNRLVLMCRRTPACEQLTWKNLSQVKRIGLGLAATPVGHYTERILELGAQRFGASWAEGVRERVVTQEAQVRRLRARVELGVLDAAIVYQSDVTDETTYRRIRPPAELDQSTELWVARGQNTANADLAQAWIDGLSSPEGQRLLKAHGLEVR